MTSEQGMDEELLAEFLTESNENLSAIEQQLMDLEANPQDEEILGAIFRAIHTVKGSCGFLGLVGLEKVAHAGENLLSKIRSLKFAMNADLVSLLLECADAITSLLEGLEAEGAEPDIDHSGLIKRLHAAERLVATMADGENSVVEAEQEDTGNESVSGGLETLQTWASDISEKAAAALAENGLVSAQAVMDVGFAKLKELDGFTAGDALKLLGVAKVVVKKGAQNAKPAAPEVVNVELPDDDSKLEVSVESKAEVVKKVVAEPQKSSPVPVKKTVVKNVGSVKPKSSGSIRVDVDLLDSLMNQVGELVLTRNRLVQMVQASGNMEFVRVSRDVDHITEQLQSKLLRTRMQPIQSVWNSVPRIVRDMGKQLEKKISVVMHGEETELDRTILNALKDPLTHIIRNSCDHGIEMPNERRKAGKPAEGTLRLSASQESGFIVILIEDDGAGIDAERVKKKAVTMGVLTEEQGEKISAKAALQLIFHAGLSTAEQVSNLSGRGVGMDVVRTEIEKVGGNVDISSEPGKGTTLRIRIPLTLAIISAMIVSCQNQRFAIPQMSIQELLSAPKDSQEWRVIGGQTFYRLRGKLLPIMRLKEKLQLSDTVEDEGSIVVIDLGDRNFGVLVDQICGAEEIVVKPLGVHFQHLGFYGGCSILGDGIVIPIFDCNELANLMQLSPEVEAIRQAENDDENDFSKDELQHTLVFSQGKQRFAIPMVLIERLELFPAERIEHSGTSEVLQYRDDVISVIRWGELIEVGERICSGEVYGLILSDGHKRMCLQVEQVEDILETPLEIKKQSENPLFLGTSVIDGTATEVIDVFEVVKKADINWFTRTASSSPNSDDTSLRQKILFVEDAAFFRNLVMPIFDVLGYEAWVAKDGLEACKILEERRPDLILTDLEMPNMNGYELTDWVREREEFDDIPIVALTATPVDEIDMTHRDKFVEVMLKLDRQSLTEGLGEVMANIKKKRPLSVEGSVVVDSSI
ncbi:MAG: chemotaxis protein CheW [Mariprofundaceae bacterium]|nr:chemotaxis protein CheW [Mariprofundaceae bacterium]